MDLEKKQAIILSVKYGSTDRAGNAHKTKGNKSNCFVSSGSDLRIYWMQTELIFCYRWT